TQATKRPKKPRQGSGSVQIIPIPLAADIHAGDSIADHLFEALRRRKISFASGDILVVKHKIISKSENQMVVLDTVDPSNESVEWARKYRLDARVIELAMREARAVIRRENGVIITETEHGFLCANSGVDVSNVDGGRHAVLLPKDPDQSAAKLRREI